MVKNTSKLVLPTRLVPQTLGKLFLRNQATINASGLGFTKYIPHLSKEGTVSHLIIERTSLYVQSLKVLVCTDLRLPGASRSQVCSWVLQQKAYEWSLRALRALWGPPTATLGFRVHTRPPRPQADPGVALRPWGATGLSGSPNSGMISQFRKHSILEPCMDLASP